MSHVPTFPRRGDTVTYRVSVSCWDPVDDGRFILKRGRRVTIVSIPEFYPGDPLYGPCVEFYGLMGDGRVRCCSSWFLGWVDNA